MYIEDIRQRIAELDKELEETRDKRLALRHQLEKNDNIRFLNERESMIALLNPSGYSEDWILSSEDVVRCFDCDDAPERVIVCDGIPFFHCEKHFDERLQAKANDDADVVLCGYNMM